MANRSYLYAVSSRPTRYDDRPERIVGLSEWAWQVPFAFDLLVSGSPTVSASLLFDGFATEPADAKTALFSITADYAQGLARFERFAAAARRAGHTSASLVEALEDALDTLRTNRDDYFLLETVELDLMGAQASDWRAIARQHAARAEQTGAAVDALSGMRWYAARQLAVAAAATARSPALRRFQPFQGLCLDDRFDSGDAPLTMGIGFWSDVLFFDPSAGADDDGES